jgi:hypothetical protein
MMERAGDVAESGVGEVVWRLLLEEGVPGPLEQRLVAVHSAAVFTEDRFRHERGIHAVLVGGPLHHRAVGLDDVRHAEAIGVPQVDLVLAWCDFVVTVLDVDPHALEPADRLLAQVIPLVQREEVEVPPFVERCRVTVAGEVEVLQLGAHEEVESHPPSLLHASAEGVARVAFVWLAVGCGDVADHPRHRIAVHGPGEDREGCRIRPGDHVAFLNPREPFDARPVEPHPLVECDLQFMEGDGEALQESEDVGEPEVDVLDAVFLDSGEHRVAIHGRASRRKRWTVRGSNKKTAAKSGTLHPGLFHPVV